MDKSQCIQLGYIAKAHGIKGEVKAVFDVHDLNEYRRVKTLYLARGNDPLRPYQVEKLRVHNQKEIILTLAESQDRETADLLRGSTIYYPEADLPALPPGHFYYFQVIGYRVVDAQRGPLGRVKDFLDGTSHDFMAMAYQGKEVLIPITDAFVGLADHEAQTIAVDLPEGLVELYTGADEEE
jgi:16S rRNA processing protein RimM